MRARGFTLIEVTVVLAVLALAATLLLPRLDAGERATVDGAARRLADAIGFGRTRAILGGTPMRLVLDLDARRWALGRPGQAPGDLAATEPAAAPPLGPPTALPPGVRVRTVASGDTPTLRDGVAVLDLLPEGDALAVRIELGDAHGHTAAVVVPPASGRPLAVTEGTS